MIVNQSSLRTIALLSNREELDVDINQSNRYCILLNSHLGKEAYYFGTPIYNSDTRKLVKREFAISNGFYQFIGSNSIVEVSAKQLIMKQNNKIFCLKFKNDISWKLQDGVLLSDTFSVIPTYNGVSIKGKIDQLAFYVSTKFFYQNIRVSQNCVCFMESRFKPIVIISALFVQSPNIGCQPMQVKYSEMSKDGGYICFSSNALSYNYGVFDVNFYEPKLIQDTPVSGKFPRENNAFGPIAFVGKTNLFGTQWLYSRLDISKVTELQDENITIECQTN